MVVRPPEGHRLILYAAVFLLLTAVLNLTAEREHVTALEAFLADRLAPIQRGLATIGAWTVKNWQALLEWRELKETNESCAPSGFADGKHPQRSITENAWLREALGLAGIAMMLPAQVIAIRGTG